jgi:hypothetical protein
MTLKDEEYKEFLIFYEGRKIPNPNIYPKRFEFMVKTFFYCKGKNLDERSNHSN